MRIFEEADYSLIPNRQKGYVFSAILLVLSVGSLAVRGLELGIDFRGGMEFVVETPDRLSATDVRTALEEPLESTPEGKRYGDQGLLIRTAPEGDISDVQNAIMQTIGQQFPQAQAKLIKTNVVGARFAEDLARGALWSVLGSLLVIFIYILVRFEWRFGLGAVAALFHDVTITLGIFSLLSDIAPFSLQIDQAIIAAFLTIVGYSLNDTVVVFDRIREYSNLFKTRPYNEIVNHSINTTLSRTVITSVTTLFVVTTLFIFGGEVLRGFSFALIIGVLIGTYSSVFVASPVVVELRDRLES
ncbi:MAG: protein translocase subunit SecF [Bacteroidetes bacterium QS_8_64_10]|nr:MAG: protein translocase subunit SecF [Bacteroidetes bacterium QS_8_64_10]